MSNFTINTDLVNDIQVISCFNCGGDMHRAGSWDVCADCGEQEQAATHNHSYNTAW